jgi:hypothetical protein
VKPGVAVTAVGIFPAASAPVLQPAVDDAILNRRSQNGDVGA